MINLLVSQAYAQTADVAPVSDTNSLVMNIAPIVVIFVIFYFLVIRPQSKKIKAHQDMLGELKTGDQVVTGGGFLGTVVSVADDNIVTVDLGNGLTVRALKQTLGGLQQTTSVSGPALQAKPASAVKNK